MMYKILIDSTRPESMIQSCVIQTAMDCSLGSRAAWLSEIEPNLDYSSVNISPMEQVFKAVINEAKAAS